MDFAVVTGPIAIRVRATIPATDSEGVKLIAIAVTRPLGNACSSACPAFVNIEAVPVRCIREVAGVDVGAVVLVVTEIVPVCVDTVTDFGIEELILSQSRRGEAEWKAIILADWRVERNDLDAECAADCACGRELREQDPQVPVGDGVLGFRKGGPDTSDGRVGIQASPSIEGVGPISCRIDHIVARTFGVSGGNLFRSDGDPAVVSDVRISGEQGGVDVCGHELAQHALEERLGRADVQRLRVVAISGQNCGGGIVHREVHPVGFHSGQRVRIAEDVGRHARGVVVGNEVHFQGIPGNTVTREGRGQNLDRIGTAAEIAGAIVEDGGWNIIACSGVHAAMGLEAEVGTDAVLGVGFAIPEYLKGQLSGDGTLGGQLGEENLMVCSRIAIGIQFSIGYVPGSSRGGVHFDGPTIHLERVGQGQVIVFDVADLRLARLRLLIDADGDPAVIGEVGKVIEQEGVERRGRDNTSIVLLLEEVARGGNREWPITVPIHGTQLVGRSFRVQVQTVCLVTSEVGGLS